MRKHSDLQLRRIGAIALVCAVLAMTAALNLQRFPGFRGETYLAEFSDASGLHKGNMVQIAGVRVGRVDKIALAGTHVVVSFSVDPGITFGDRTTASVEVLNVLGEKFLRLKPEGKGDTKAGATIPLSRTDASYDIVQVFGELADTTERIDVPQLQTALSDVASTMNRSSEEARDAFSGLSRLSETIASRDDDLQDLLKKADSVAGLLAQRKGDVVTLVKNGNLILAELRKRSRAIHTLLVSTRTLAKELGGLVDDNQAQLAPMLEQLQEVTQILVDRRKALRSSIHNLGPYVSILSNIIGTGPWFDAYAVNLGGLGTGEFLPGLD